jgi:hypothetical protein
MNYLKERKNFSVILIIAFLTCSTCNSQLTKSTSMLTLGKTEYVEILNRIKYDLEIQNKVPDVNFNFHLRYTELLNRNSIIVEVVMDNSFPNTNSEICNHIEIDDTILFVYNNPKCDSKGIKVLKKKNMLNDNKFSPFSKYDTFYWKILIMKKQGDIFYERISSLSGKLDGEEEIDLD